jgi:hypothetical protein
MLDFNVFKFQPGQYQVVKAFLSVETERLQPLDVKLPHLSQTLQALQRGWITEPKDVVLDVTKLADLKERLCPAWVKTGEGPVVLAVYQRPDSRQSIPIGGLVLASGEETPALTFGTSIGDCSLNPFPALPPGAHIPGILAVAQGEEELGVYLQIDRFRVNGSLKRQRDKLLEQRNSIAPEERLYHIKTVSVKMDEGGNFILSRPEDLIAVEMARLNQSTHVRGKITNGSKLPTVAEFFEG